MREIYSMGIRQAFIEGSLALLGWGQSYQVETELGFSLLCLLAAGKTCRDSLTQVDCTGSGADWESVDPRCTYLHQ